MSIINENEMKLEFLSKANNEAFARITVAAFVSQLDPTIEEISDIKTAVSEAVTNSIVHGYENKIGIIKLTCKIADNEIFIEISDSGKGIENIEMAKQPLYTTKPNLERSGMGFTIMESFMDNLEVESIIGVGTKVTMSKKIKIHRTRRDTNHFRRSSKGVNNLYENDINTIKRAQNGDKDEMSKLVEENQGLVWSIVKRFTGRGYDTEDIYQIGCMGLVKAIRRFNIDFDVRLSTYAVPYILGEIKRFLRDDGPIKVSRSLKELNIKIKELQKESIRKNNEELTLRANI